MCLTSFHYNSGILFPIAFVKVYSKKPAGFIF
ncbi:Uncharacterised protein [Mycobacterium tuberculosis]|nr:Uncharacterised protein [Mycobacterium tuberculosis]